VHVIGHNDIAPDCKVVPLVCSAPLIGKNFCNLPRGKDSPAFKRARRYEVDRPIDPNPPCRVDVCAWFGYNADHGRGERSIPYSETGITDAGYNHNTGRGYR